METREVILKTLPGFSGSEEKHHWSGLFRRHLLTDGAQFVAESAGAYWLMDAIASYVRKTGHEHLQHWTLTRTPGTSKATLIGTDMNGKVLAKQHIGYTDFPLEKIDLYCEFDLTYWTIMLPSEH